MSEWWTYSLSDFLLFSPRTYYRLFELYNAEIWPAQIAALALGAGIAVLIRRGEGTGARIAAAILALCWVWVALAFHAGRYASINWAAPWFGAAFGVEAALLLWAGVLRGTFSGTRADVVARRAGIGLFVYALLLHPFVPVLVGRAWEQAEIFGVAPAPTVLATLGVVLFACPGRWVLLLIPAAWCAIEGASLWAMDAPEAWLLPTLGVVALTLQGLQGAAPARAEDGAAHGRRGRPR